MCKSLGGKIRVKRADRSPIDMNIQLVNANREPVGAILWHQKRISDMEYACFSLRRSPIQLGIFIRHVKYLRMFAESPGISVHRRQRQGDGRFEASLGYIVRDCLKKRDFFSSGKHSSAVKSA